MDITLLILVAIAAVVLHYVWSIYNNLATGKVRIEEALSGIDVQLKRRVDLIPNLLETVKGYAKHEKEIFENVTKARSSLVNAESPAEKAQGDNMLAGALKSLFAIAENYPTLKASDNFKELQEELEDTENKIAYSRQFYNSVVMDYNAKLQVFPNVFFAKILNFKPAEFFAATEAEKKEVKVSF